MASPRNPDGVRLRGFVQGVNNVAPDQDMPADEFGRPMAVRAAVNVDFVGPSKKARKREGYTLKASGRFHSPFAVDGASMMAVQDGNLCLFDRQCALTDVLRAGVGTRHISATHVNDDVYWSNGLELRRVRGSDYADTPGWIDCPAVPLADAHASGSLEPGEYRVAMTWLDDEGRESGALGAALVTLQTGGGIRVHGIPPAPEGAVTARIYLSPPNGEEMYRVMDLLPGATQVLVSAPGEGKLLETLWRQPLPPCEILRFWNGRLLGASGNLLIWSDALRFGLTTHDKYMRFGAGITLLEPIGDGTAGAGIWIADHKRTYWLDGGDPGRWSRRIMSDVAAVPGTSIVLDAADLGLDSPGKVAAWLSSDGVFTAGLPNGQLVDLTRGRLALPEGRRGASLFRESKGLRQMVTSFLGTTPNPLAIGDRASATVTRHTPL